MPDTTKMKEADVRKKIRTVAIVTGVVALVLGFEIGMFVGQRKNVPVVAVGGVAQNTAQQGALGSSTNDSRATANSAAVVDTNALAIGSALSAPSVAAITVSDQKPGITALVSLVSTDAPAWLALRENANGLVGNILGAKRIDVGTNGNVEIPLLRATQAGKSYFVVLFKDNGDKVFDFKTDAPMTADGVLISKTFTVHD